MSMKKKGGKGAAKLQPSLPMLPKQGGEKGVSLKRDYPKGKAGKSKC